MLRISRTETPSDVKRLQLQGRLVGPWVAELQRAVSDLDTPVSLLQLELADVQFVDADGIALLQQLLSQGAQLSSVSPFVRELLHTRLA